MGIALKEPKSGGALDQAFAEPSDYAVCRKLHRKYGATYYFATLRFRPEIRRRTHALYGFVRVPDEWVDNPGELSLDRQTSLLRDWRGQFLRGLDGVVPDHPVMRAFCDLVHETGMPVDEPLTFLEAMEQDLSVSRYQTYQDLRDYMRGSAAAVGLMMCRVLGAPCTNKVEKGACALGEAMQLTNFIRDVGEDADRGRIYLPLEDLASFDVSENDLIAGHMTPEIMNLVRFEIARARALYAEADRAIPLLPADTRKAVMLSRILYSKILDKIEKRDFNVFTGRARTSKLEKLVAAVKVMLTR